MIAIAIPEHAEHRHAGVVEVPAAEVRERPVDRSDGDEDQTDEDRVPRMLDGMHQGSRLQDVERGEEGDPDDVDEVPVERRSLDGVVVA